MHGLYSTNLQPGFESQSSISPTSPRTSIRAPILSELSSYDSRSAINLHTLQKVKSHAVGAQLKVFLDSDLMFDDH